MTFIGVLCKTKKHTTSIYLSNFTFVSKMGKSKLDSVLKSKKKMRTCAIKIAYSLLDRYLNVGGL